LPEPLQPIPRSVVEAEVAVESSAAELPEPLQPIPPATTAVLAEVLPGAKTSGESALQAVTKRSATKAGRVRETRMGLLLKRGEGTKWTGRWRSVHFVN
jgi:hypothetical protein